MLKGRKNYLIFYTFSSSCKKTL